MKTAAFAAATLALLQACAAPAAPAAADWPADLPPRDAYVRAWQDDPQNQTLQPVAGYLGWVLRFYAGSGLLPGWVATSRDLIAGLPDAEQDLLAPRLADLGRVLSAEWAKDNRCRRVTSAMLALWGRVMRRAREEQRVLASVDRLARDVRDLLAGRLPPVEITAARYEGLLATSAGTP